MKFIHQTVVFIVRTELHEDTNTNKYLWKHVAFFFTE